jgi:hypothetical protein
MDEDPDENRDALTTRDKWAIAAQSLIKGIPVVGSSLDHAIFAATQERRMKRLEDTLQEVVAALKAKGAAPDPENERLIALLEGITPAIAAASSEEKRKRLRDLVYNAAVLAEDDPSWNDVDLAADLVGKIDPPGLSVLAAVGLINGQVIIAMDPEPTVYVDDPSSAFKSKVLAELPYSPVAIEEWGRRLQQMRLIYVGSHGVDGTLAAVQLTPLGTLLIRWATSDMGT